MRWNGTDMEPPGKDAEEHAEPDAQNIYAAMQQLKSSGRNLRVKQREEKVRTIGGADILHVAEKGKRREQPGTGKTFSGMPHGKQQGKPAPHPKEGSLQGKSEQAQPSPDKLADDDMDSAESQAGLTRKETPRDRRAYGRMHGRKAVSGNAKSSKANVHSLAKKARNIATVSYQYGRNTDGQGRGMKGVKNALAKLEEKELAREQVQMPESIEARLRVSDSHAKEKEREQARSSPDGRLKAFRTQDEDKTTAGASEKRLKTESRRYMDKEEHARRASAALHTRKKQKKRNSGKEDKKDKEKAGRKVSVSNMLKKAEEMKKQLDSGDVSDVSPGQGFLNLITGQLKNAAQTVSSALLKKLLIGLLSFVMHIMATAAMLIVMFVCVIMGMLMAVLGPILVVIICVASIFSFLFTSETEDAVDTKSEEYIDNYISALLIEYRDMIADDYANESSLIGGDFLEYDLCYEIMGEDREYLSGQVSYDKDDDITSKENDAKRTKASNKLLNDALAKGGTYRQEFLDNIKMIYFAKMCHEDDVSLDDESEDDQTSPYLMINTGTEEDMLEEIFWEFCTISKTEKKVTWKSGNKPYPFRMTDEYSNKGKNMKYTKARYVEVRVLTMEEYLNKHPLNEEELKYYNEFAEIKKPQQ